MRQKTELYKVFELRTDSLDYSGVGAINKVNDIAEVLKKDGITKMILIPDCNKNTDHLADSAKNEDCCKLKNWSIEMPIGPYSNRYRVIVRNTHKIRKWSKPTIKSE